MVNRSRNMRKNRSRSRSRSRRMRGGQDQVANQNPVVANQNPVVANQNPVVVKPNLEGVKQNPEVVKPEDSWLSSIPGASVVTGAFDTAKEETSSFLGDTAGEVTGIASTGTEYVKSFLPGTGEEPVAAAPMAQGTVEPKKWWQIFGGKRRSRQMRMKGGRDLGLDYYATPVSGLRVAQPTYMEYYKGGKRSRIKRRSYRRKRRTCKRRRRR